MIIRSDNQQDSALWNDFRLGDELAFARIYQYYSDTLHAYGKSFSRDSLQVEDTIHDLFITLWRTRRNLSPVGNIKYYLFRSLRRDLRRVHEREIRFEKINPETFIHFESCGWDSYDSAGDEPEQTRRLELIVQELPKRQREAISLRYYKNFSIREIAFRMNISDQTTRNTLHNALCQLRRNAYRVPRL